MKLEFVISAVGLNVTGIVARVSKAVYESGCNFEDSSMTLLGNHFALMVLVTAEDEKMSRNLAVACDRLQQDKDLNVTLFPVDWSRVQCEVFTEPNYEIRVKGKDRMGIVYRTTQLLSSLKVNILELETRLEPGKNGDSVFNMRTAVAVPRDVSGERLRKDLKFLAEENEETISLTRI